MRIIVTGGAGFIGSHFINFVGKQFFLTLQDDTTFYNYTHYEKQETSDNYSPYTIYNTKKYSIDENGYVKEDENGDNAVLIVGLHHQFFFKYSENKISFYVGDNVLVLVPKEWNGA